MKPQDAQFAYRRTYQSFISVAVGAALLGLLCLTSGCDQLVLDTIAPAFSEELAASEQDAGQQVAERDTQEQQEQLATSAEGQSGVPVVTASPLAGMWTGQATWTVTQTIDGPTPMSQEFAWETDLTLDFDDEGIPLALGLPILGSGGASGEEVRAGLVKVGESHTDEQVFVMSSAGQETTISTTSTVTVREASFDAEGFRIVYDYDMLQTYTGGGLDGHSQRMTGTSAYESQRVGDTLEYTQVMDADFEQSMGGGFVQTGRQEMVCTTTLKRL